MVLFLFVTGILGALYEKEKAESGVLMLQRECGSLKLSDLVVRKRYNCRAHSAHMPKAMTHMEDTHNNAQGRYAASARSLKEKYLICWSTSKKRGKQCWGSRTQWSTKESVIDEKKNASYSLFPFKIWRCSGTGQPISGLVKSGLNGRVAAKRPYLQHGNKVKQLSYARKPRISAAEQWQQVVWTCESKFETYGCRKW